MAFRSVFVLAVPHTINELKVAYLYNIAKFTRWPERTWTKQSDPFYFCFYGDNGVTDELLTLQKREINDHLITLLKPESTLDFQRCNAFYIQTDKRHLYRYLLSLIDQKKVLVITDESPFFDYGGLMNLVEVKQRIRFQINKKQLDNSQLKFSSKLLKLGILIY